MAFANSSLRLTQTVPSSVYAFIRGEILQGQHPPGSPLKQDELAARLGVSKIPLREAFSRLESEGLVVLKPRRGYFVATLDISEIAELFELRASIEALAGRLAAIEHTPEIATKVVALADQMAALDPASDFYHQEWCNLNREFHETIITSSHKHHVIRIAMQLRNLVEPYIRLDNSMSMDDTDSDFEHRDIASAFMARNGDRVAALSAAHCRHTCERLLASLQARSGANP